MSPFSSVASGPISRTLRSLHTRPAGARPAALAAVLATGTLALAGCGSSHPRTEVLRSANPLTSDIYVRITGPGGAVSYVARRFMSGGEFSRFRFSKEPREGPFLPPRVRDRKLCSSTHVIRDSDAPALQRWRRRTLEITVYGIKVSAIYCAALGPNIYAGS
ncbi:MAG TPA: hypothetical protein VGK68_11795 [Gaiellaceae bacterium]